MLVTEHRLETGLSRDPGYLVSGRNSGYQSIGLAVHLGAVRIILLGYDMERREGEAIHWHGSHEPPLLNPQPHHFDDWRERFAGTVPDLAEMGIEVLNCSRNTALTCFPRSRLEDVL